MIKLQQMYIYTNKIIYNHLCLRAAKCFITLYVKAPFGF